MATKMVATLRVDTQHKKHVKQKIIVTIALYSS